MAVTSRDPARQSQANRLSRLSLAMLATAFAAGIAAGAVSYVRRSPAVQGHVAGSNGIAFEIVVAVVSVAVVAGVQVWQARRPRSAGYSLWTAPLRVNAMSRLGLTLRIGCGFRVPDLIRVPAVLLVLLIALYSPFRMGEQVIGGLDPSSTVNAWGGPTYLGALLAHWLDAIVIFYVAAFVLKSLLVTTGRR